MPRSERCAEIQGDVSGGFEPVRMAFEENFTRRRELGGACCVYHRGEKVVDLWGGVRDVATGAPWEPDTMVLVYSATKGLAAMVMALAHSRGWLDYDARVARYWPEFAQNGKDGITVRQLLAHQAGLFALDGVVDRALLADLDKLAEHLARQEPEWPAGERQAYHALSLGFFEGELIRRVDPRRRTLGQVFQEEIAGPLGLETYVRLPDAIPDERLAIIEKSHPVALMLNLPLPLYIATFNKRSNLYRSLFVNPGGFAAHDESRIYVRELEVPSGGGVTSARGLAGAYDAFCKAGGALSLRRETLEELQAPARPPRRGFYDEVIKAEARFSLGFMKPFPDLPFGSDKAFGSPGAGGALGFADPETGVAYAYVTNRMGPKVLTDPREKALRAAVATSLGHLP